MMASACATTTGRLTRNAIQPFDGRDAAQAAYIDQLVERAQTLRLSTKLEWRRLGHWRSTVTGGSKSQADGPNFFLSPRGVTNPGAELEATLRGFFATLPPKADTKGDDVQHPICQFPARYRWLDKQLGFDAARMPHPACSRYAEFRDQTHAERLSFVFSSYYLNNPASVFGHTFVRIVKRETPENRGRPELLDRAIEFSATVDTSNALVYGFKGVFGLFPGTYRNVPYYFKVRQYNDYESRDLYEYELALTDDEIQMFLAHLWELGSTFFDYFYISENCSYHLLSALETARPSLDLLEHMHWPVIPADTIKALYANPGLVKSVRFRPSLRRTFKERLRHLPAEDHDLVERVMTDPSMPLPTGLPPARAIGVFDAAADLVDIVYAKALTHEVDSAPARVKQRLLERRSEILVPSEAISVSTPWQNQPQLGHDSRRVGVGFAFDNEGAQSYVFDTRLALHDLADPTPGYPEQSQLEFLPIRARVRIDNRGEGKRFQLDSASLVRIISLTPQDRFDRKLSWKADFGVVRIEDEGCNGCYAGRLAIGTGFALATKDARLTAFLTLDFHLLSGPSLEGIEGIPVRAGLGPAGGVRLRLAKRLVSLTTGELIWLPTQDPTATWYARSILRYAFGPMFALNLESSLDARAQTNQFSALVYF